MECSGLGSGVLETLLNDASGMSSFQSSTAAGVAVTIVKSCIFQ
jgi:hypothetical protein